MDWALTLSFMGVALVLIIMPGPDNLFVLAQSIAQGKMAGIATTLGLCTGLLVHITAAAAGISAVIYQSAVAFNFVKYAGAAYLLYLAWRAFREKGSAIALESANVSALRSLYKRGILMSSLNPKVSLFFLALLPQFTNPSSGYVPLQMIVLGVIFLMQSLVMFSLISIFSDQVRKLLIHRPAIAQRLNLVQGTLLGLIGLSLAVRR